MENRIGQLSIGAAGDRQTARNEFGAMLARGVGTSSLALMGVASSVVPGGAIVTAAVTRAASYASASGGRAAVGGGGAPGSVSPGSPTGQTDGGGLEAQRELMLQNQRWTAEYLSLQNEMQRESREFTAISNILKVRHESAKTAINNVR